MFMMGMQVLVKEFIWHGSIGGGGDKKDVFGKVGTFAFEDFNHELAGLLQVLSINLDFNSCGVAFVVTFATRDPIRGEANFKVGVVCLDHCLNDFVHGIAAMEGGRHVAEETGRSNVVGVGKAMGAKEEVVGFEPVEDAVVALKVPDG